MGLLKTTIFFLGGFGVYGGFCVYKLGSTFKILTSRQEAAKRLSENGPEDRDVVQLPRDPAQNNHSRDHRQDRRNYASL